MEKHTRLTWIINKPWEKFGKGLTQAHKMKASRLILSVQLVTTQSDPEGKENFAVCCWEQETLFLQGVGGGPVGGRGGNLEDPCTSSNGWGWEGSLKKLGMGPENCQATLAWTSQILIQPWQQKQDSSKPWVGGGSKGGWGGIDARQTHHPITREGCCSTLPDAQLGRSRMDTPVHCGNVKWWW